MTEFYSVTRPLAYSFAGGFKTGMHSIGNLTGRIVRIIRNLPYHLQHNPNAAFAFFATANAILFTTIHLFASWLDRRIENPGHAFLDHNQNPNLNTMERVVKHIFLDLILVGGSMFVLNVAISKATRQPLSEAALAIITTSAIALHIILNFLFTSRADQVQGPTEEEEDLENSLADEAETNETSQETETGEAKETTHVSETQSKANS